MSRKLKQLIRLEDLANVYAGIINNYFDVCVNAVTRVDPIKPCGLMLATRQPYKISNIKAESMQIALRFYLECEDEDKYNDTLATLNQLVGYNKGTFTSNEKEFRYFSYLDFAKPLSEPEVNCGKFYQTVELMGTCLVTQQAGGVLISNEVETEICFKPGTSNEQSGKIEVLSSTSALVKAQESPQMANAVVGKTINTTQLFSYSYTILVLKDAISERIIKALTNVEPLGVNEKIKIIDKYPAFSGDAFSVERNVVLTGGQINLNAGAFANAQITLQDRLDIGNIDIDNSDDSSGDSGIISGGSSGSLNGRPSSGGAIIGGNGSGDASTYTALVTLNGPNLTVTSITGDYSYNEDGTISCSLGTVISISVTGTKTSVSITGADYNRTNDVFYVSPKNYDVIVTTNEVFITTSIIDDTTQIV